jgi:folate-binding protein YgfZ
MDGYRRAPAGILEISGDDRVAFLQGQCTNDVSGMPAGSILAAACLTPKGKILFVFRLAKLPDRLRLLLPAERAGTAAAHLHRYAVFQKVSVEDASTGIVRFDFWGELEAGPESLPPQSERWPADHDISESWVVPEAAAAAVEANLAAVPVLAPEEAKARRIEAGRPVFGVDFDETNVPDEVDLGDAVSTRKGCYVGQEIVARMRTYGKVAKRLTTLVFDGGLPPRGSRLVRPGEPGREAGWVTSAVRSARLGEIGIGYVQREIADGETLAVAEMPEITVRVLPLPGK